MKAPNLSLDQKKELIEQIKDGVEIPELRESVDKIKEKLQNFVKTGDSTSIFLSGVPGSGKSFAVDLAMKETVPENIWTVVIDCRIFDTDKAVSKEFLRQTGNLLTTPILEVLTRKGAGIIVLDHFDSLKIIKRQFFLYTIFDSIHTNTISLCSILITSSVEPLSNLEKRVRSRLTPQYIDIPKPTIQWCKEWIVNVLQFKEAKQSDRKKWNRYVKAFFNEERNIPDTQLEELFSISPTLQCAVVFAQKFVLSNEHETIEQEFIDGLSVDRFLGALSQNELMLLFIAAFLINIKSIVEFNFDQLYKELTELRKLRDMRKIKREQALLAWEKLTYLNFLVPTSKDKTTFTLTLFSEDLEKSVSQVPTEMQVWINTWLKY